MASTGRKCLENALSANKKSTLSLNVFYRYYTLQGPTICQENFGNNSRTKFLPDMDFFAVFASPR